MRRRRTNAGVPVPTRNADGGSSVQPSGALADRAADQRRAGRRTCPNNCGEASGRVPTDDSHQRPHDPPWLSRDSGEASPPHAVTAAGAHKGKGEWHDVARPGSDGRINSLHCRIAHGARTRRRPHHGLATPLASDGRARGRKRATHHRVPEAGGALIDRDRLVSVAERSAWPSTLPLAKADAFAADIAASSDAP